MASQESERITCNVCEGSGSECICEPVCSCPWNGVPLPSCVFYSPRIQGLYEGERTEFETATEHWTMVDPNDEEEVERIGEENKKYFNEVSVKHPEWGAFFSKFQDLEMGEKIGEGGQAEILAATTQRDTDLVAKVFMKDVPLKNLNQQWPPQMMSASVSDGYYHPSANVLGGAFLRDGEYKNRFAFVMWRRWGDL